jgi:hypothetical protein
MELRLGELLVESGVLNERQVQEILDRQQDSAEPFGLLAERLFRVDPGAIEAAWARQYASLTRTIDPEVEVFDEKALELVTRRQAWQFRVLPVRFEPRELMMATTQVHLRRALRFATNVIGIPVFLVMAEPGALGRALCRHYPMPGMTPTSVLNDGLESMLRNVTNRAA